MKEYKPAEAGVMCTNYVSSMSTPLNQTFSISFPFTIILEHFYNRHLAEKQRLRL